MKNTICKQRQRAIKSMNLVIAVMREAKARISYPIRLEPTNPLKRHLTSADTAHATAVLSEIKDNTQDVFHELFLLRSLLVEYESEEVTP